ncbi:MAG TPA: CAP domain-containing protein [Eubacteriales bacterium]|nr:CAP domain-containing protein [Clostridia bacterium]HRV73042.1 CAP domain-containing protein [Eubacteriales bacterium]
MKRLLSILLVISMIVLPLAVSADTGIGQIKVELAGGDKTSGSEEMTEVFTEASASAADFSFTDVNGTVHNMLDYSGKTIIALYGNVVRSSSVVTDVVNTVKIAGNLKTAVGGDDLVVIFFEMSANNSATTIKEAFSSASIGGEVIAAVRDGNTTSRVMTWYENCSGKSMDGSVTQPLCFVLTVGTRNASLNYYGSGAQTSQDFEVPLAMALGGDIFGYPVGLEAVSGTNGVELSWLAYAQGYGYRIYRSAYGADNFAEIGTSDTGEYTDESAAANAAYDYKVLAYKDADDSAFSHVVFGRWRVSTATEASDALAEELAYLVNCARYDNGAELLLYSPELCDAAQYRAEEVEIKSDHYRPNSKWWSNVLDELGIGCTASVEFIGSTTRSKTSAELLSAWLNMESNKKYLVSNDYSYVGVGCYQTGDSDSTVYWCVIFTETNTPPEGLSYPANVYADFTVSVNTAVIGQTVKLTAAGGEAYKLSISAGAETTELGSDAEYEYTCDKQGLYSIVCEITGGDGLVTSLTEKLSVTREYMRGDANSSGNVNSEDAAMILRYLVGLCDMDYTEIIAADIDGTTGVSANDASKILRYLVGLADEL